MTKDSAVGVRSSARRAAVATRRSPSPGQSSPSASPSTGGKRPRSGKAASGLQRATKRRKQSDGNDSEKDELDALEAGSPTGDASDGEGEDAESGGPPKKTKPQEFNADGEEIFCVCRDVWDGEEFMIQCDECGEWCVRSALVRLELCVAIP